MNDIIEPTIDYDFSKLYLGPPSTLSGGSYFTRIMYNSNKHLFIQTPKCTTKQGFVKSGKKIYTDLMFDNNDTVFINWIENLESACLELLLSKSNDWFENKLEKDDIEAAFTSPLKIFKSGKYYLLRVNVKPNIKVYNEDDEIIKIDDVTSEYNIISILEIQGIKFSTRNFQIEMELKQSLVVSPDPFLDECFIKKPIKKHNKTSNYENNYDNTLDDLIQDSINDLKNANININTSKPLETSNKSLETSNKSLEPSNKSLETFNKSLEPSNKSLETSNKSLEPSNKSLETSNKSLETSNKSLNMKIDLDNIENINLDKKNDALELINTENNVSLDIEDLNNTKVEDDPSILQEFDVSESLENNLETITLKKPNQVYYEIYQKAREKAKEAKKAALLAYLEVKNIKKTYMIEDMDNSDDESELYENSDNEEIDLED
jgi:hypothetical protein